MNGYLAMSRIFGLCLVLLAATASAEQANNGGPFVFAYFNTGEQGQSQGLQFAYSRDGYQWTRIAPPGESFFKPTVGGKLFRDPSIAQGPDGVFHMVWTTDWHTHGIGIAHGKDLIHWSGETYLDPMKDVPGCLNHWAPEITYDAQSKTYLIYWASTVRGKFTETEGKAETLQLESIGNVRQTHRIYVTTTKDFNTYTPARLFFDDGFNCIDAFLVHDPPRDRWVMVVKNENRLPKPEKNLHVAYGKSPFGPWSKSSGPISPNWAEGPAVLKVGDRWLLYYDAYTRDRYEGLKTLDFDHWTPLEKPLVMPRGIRHGTAFPVSEEVLRGLLALGQSSDNADWAQPIKMDGVPNLHRVSDTLYRSAQPTAEGMKNLKEKLGIKTIISLRSFHSDRDEIGKIELGYEHITMKAWHPEKKEAVRFLQIVTDPKRQPVLVHCQHGADRTGTMCAIYRIAVQKRPKEAAVKEMREGGFGFHEIWTNLPDWIDALDVEKIKETAGSGEAEKKP